MLSVLTCSCVLLLGVALSHEHSPIPQFGLNERMDFNANVTGTKVCLNMIAKNEIARLNETLTAVFQHITSWILCDTGSVDGTADFTTSFFDRGKRPGVVVHHSWENFAHNRNLCLAEGTRQMSHLCEYWLLIDADEVVVSSNGLSLAEMKLDKDAYMMHERSHGTSWARLKLVKVMQPWRWRGTIHEYLSIGVPHSQGAIPTSIYSRHGAKKLKRPLQEDIRLLQLDLKRNRHDGRAHFHLAALYGVGGLADFNASIRHSVKRIQIPGPRQQVYVSWFYIGMSLERAYLAEMSLESDVATILAGIMPLQNRVVAAEDVIAAYQAAFHILPSRKEAPYKLARFYRLYLGNQTECYKYAMHASLSQVSMTSLFARERIAKFGVDYELCACGYKAGGAGDAQKEGKDACRRLHNNLVSAPYHPQNKQLMQDTRHYMQLY
jgi:glycosyltransferase involved in cell wall biosynthesis